MRQPRRFTDCVSALNSSIHSPSLSLTAAGLAMNSLMRTRGNGPVIGGTPGDPGVEVGSEAGVGVGVAVAASGVGVAGWGI